MGDFIIKTLGCLEYDDWEWFIYVEDVMYYLTMVCGQVRAENLRKSVLTFGQVTDAIISL